MTKVTRLVVVIWLILPIHLLAQSQINGKIINAETREPIEGASIQNTEGSGSTISGINGSFLLNSNQGKYNISFIGFSTEQVQLNSGKEQIIALQPITSSLQEIVVSANREAVKRSEAPIAISLISNKMLREAKPVTLDQVLNKVSGVYMVNLGNEQHEMSIRQPMTTKSLFLYLED